MKKAIVVGATSGIGKELAIVLVNNGYQVGICGRRLHLLEDLKKDYPDQMQLEVVDAKAEDYIQRLNTLTETLGGLDLLIISSGVGEINKELKFVVEKETVDVNVTAFTEAMDWGYNYFKSKGSGHLASISSIAALRGNRHAPAYSASKAYQSNYMEGLRQKANKDRITITVSDIRPGFVDTPMAKSSDNGKLFWVAPAPKAARQIYEALQQRKKVAYITKRWRLIAFLLRAMPRGIYEKL